VFEDERERKKFFKKMSKKEPQGSGGGVGKDFSLEAGSHCVAQAYLSLLVSSISPTSASSVAGITGLHHNAQLWKLFNLSLKNKVGPGISVSYLLS
jgi:hypothetical protein